MGSTTIIVILSTFIVALLAWFIISVKMRLWLKVIITTIIVLLGIPLWYTTADLRGFATEKSLPTKYQLLWAEVIEPTVSTTEAGLYLLIRPLDRDTDFTDNFILHSISQTEPRLFRLSYDKKEHQEVQELLELIKEGESIFMDTSGEGGDGDGNGGSGEGEGEGEGEGNGRQGGDSENGIDGEGGMGDRESDSRLGYRFRKPRPRKH